MKSINFTFENIKKIEEFTGAKLRSYFQIGTPSGTFAFDKKENEPEREFSLKEGELIYKDEAGKLYKAV